MAHDDPEVARRLQTLERELSILRRREQELTDFIENAAMGLHWVGPDGTILWANQAELDLLGYTREEYVGRNIAEFHADQPVIDDILRCLSSKETIRDYEARMIHKNGSIRHVLISSNVLWDDERFVHTRCLTRDITERKEHESEIARANARLNEILESISEAFFALDRNWRFTYVNERVAQGAGCSRQQLIGRNIWEVFPAAKDAEFHEQYQRVMIDRVPAHFRVKYPERALWFDVHAQPTDEGLSAYVVDVTEQKQAEDAVSRLAAIVESSEDAIVGKNLDGIIQSWNKGAERIYGYTAEDIVGKSMVLLLPPNRPQEEAHILSRLVRGERVEHFETVRVRKDGRQIFVSVTSSPIFDRRGHIIGASHVARDITERKQFEDRLRETQRLESLGILAGGVAHDFNNLLTGILGNASLALEITGPTHPNHNLLKDVVNAAERAADLTRQLLAYAGKGRFVTELVNLSELVREISNLVQRSIPKHVQLRLDLAERLPTVEADAGQLQQIIMNLVINGAEAITGSMGTVCVSTAVQEADSQYISTMSEGGAEIPPGKYISLEVYDTGVGMDEATRAKIFDPFFTTKFTGRGLGLSAVLGIVRSHKGAIKVYSAPGQGSTFKILLPAAEAEHPIDAVPDVSSNLRGHGTILVVDDELVVRQTAKNSLERYGYDVLLAEDGRVAVDLFRERASEISVILLDLTMPVMGGEEALRELKLVRPDVAVVLSSGFNEVEAIRRFTGKGLTGFIQKPYTAAALAEKIKKALSRDEATMAGAN
jgi:two-component system, cell cycle sensor histidine kinase and response regulator CckA